MPISACPNPKALFPWIDRASDIRINSERQTTMRLLANWRESGIPIVETVTQSVESPSQADLATGYHRDF